LTVTNNENSGYDLKSAIDKVDHYAKSTGMRVMLLDEKGACLHDNCQQEKLCGLCRNIENLLNITDMCKHAHMYGIYQAERFGGQYIFFCPLGLTHWVSPIITDGTRSAALLGGPVHMVEPEEFLFDDILKKYNITKNELKMLIDYIHEIPLVKPDRVNSLSELLYMVSLNIADEKPSIASDGKSYVDFQSDISEYLQYIKTMGGSENTDDYPFEKEKQLLSYISLGDKANSQRILNEVLGYIFFSTGKNFELIKARVLELVVLLSRAALEGGAEVEQIFGLNFKYLSQINNFTSTEDMAFWLSKIMARFTDCVFDLSNVKHVDVIYKAIDYIKKNYMKKITLDDVAKHVYLSKSYFSKIFKEEIKQNFNSYLNNLRIDTSKKLLLDDSIELIDISNLVGYEDQSYFSKVFKKLVGMSPGKFREAKGIIKYKV
jgi:two-component system response regulator YesN